MTDPGSDKPSDVPPSGGTPTPPPSPDSGFTPSPPAPEGPPAYTPPLDVPPPPAASAPPLAATETRPLTASEVNQKKLLAGILGILLGTFGVHKFILGYNQEGIIMLVISVVSVVLTCFLVGYLGLLAMWVIGLVEGIIYLTKSDSEFEATYIKAKKGWF